MLLFFFLIGNRYDGAEQPEPSPLLTIEPDDFCSFVRKPDKNIEAELGAVPPLAVQCSLKDIVPKNAVSKSCLCYFRRILFILRFILKNLSA